MTSLKVGDFISQGRRLQYCDLTYTVLKTVVFKGDGGYKGAQIIRNYTLTPATLEYYVVVANASIALDGAHTHENDSVVSDYEIPGASGV